MSASRQRRTSILLCLCLAALIAAVYWPVGRPGFLNYDDDHYVTANPHVLGGLTVSDMAWAFTARYEANWHPLTWLSHALDCEWFGMNAGGHHAVSVLLHTASTLLLFLVLLRMTGATWRSACVAALFGVHPLHVESVAWVAERKDVLSGLFWMLAMWGYVRYAERPTRGRYAVALGWYAMGLMAKPMLVTLPFVLLLLDYWPLGRTRWAHSVVGNKTQLPLGRLVWEKVPFFALAAASCGVTFWAQYTAGAVNSLGDLPVGPRLANAIVSYARYLEKTVWPARLAVFYPYRQWPLPAVIAAAVIVATVSAMAIWRVRREPFLAVGWCWFLGTLVPVIGLVQVGLQSMADRYAYLPSIGLFIMLCWSMPARALERWNVKAITGIAAAAALATCAALSRVQLAYWKDSETLFRHALDVTRNNWLAHERLGADLMGQGRLPEAIGHLEQALQIRPSFPEALNNLAVARMRQGGRLSEVIAHLEQALQIDPDFTGAHYNLGDALVQAGRLPEAVGHYEQALRLDPDFAGAHSNLGIALARLGRMPEAMEHWGQALRINPDLADARNNLRLASAQLGAVPERIERYQQALRINPDDAQAHNNLGTVFLQTGRIREAIDQYEQVLRIKPDDAEAHSNLGIALASLGRMPEAMEHWDKALRLNPDLADAHNNLGVALMRQGRAPEAIQHFHQALRIKSDYAEAHYGLALALEMTGSAPEAIQHYEQALKLRPDLAAASNALARLQAHP
jgi:protein O-mannosyl-transferase